MADPDIYEHLNKELFDTCVRYLRSLPASERSVKMVDDPQSKIFFFQTMVLLMGMYQAAYSTALINNGLQPLLGLSFEQQMNLGFFQSEMPDELSYFATAVQDYMGPNLPDSNN